MKSVNKVLAKSEKLQSFSTSAANSSHKLAQTYAPAVLEYLPEKKISPELIVMITLVGVVLILIALGATHLLIDTASVIYPCYASIFALETPQPEDDKQWLTYWLIFTFMKTTDRFTRPILSFIPFFPVLKILFFGWLYHPDFLGAKVLYSMFQPHFRAVIEFFEPDFNMTPEQKEELRERQNAADALNRVEQEREKAAVTKDRAQRPLSDITDKENKENATKKNSAAVKKDTDQTRANKAVSPTQEDGAQLTLIINRVTSGKEQNLYCEARVEPPCKFGYEKYTSETPTYVREKKGIEGVTYKTDKVPGETCVFNKSMKFTPLVHLDGDVVVDIIEKPTFGEAKVLGRVRMSLLEVSQGAPAKVSTIAARYVDGESKGLDVEGLSLHMSVQLLVG